MSGATTNSGKATERIKKSGVDVTISLLQELLKQLLKQPLRLP